MATIQRLSQRTLDPTELLSGKVWGEDTLELAQRCSALGSREKKDLLLPRTR
jgi:hypothetical protein